MSKTKYETKKVYGYRYEHYADREWNLWGLLRVYHDEDRVDSEGNPWPEEWDLCYYWHYLKRGAVQEAWGELDNNDKLKEIHLFHKGNRKYIVRPS